MATIQDALDAVTAARARVEADLAGLQATVAQLQAQVAAVDLQSVVDAANAIDPTPVIPEAPAEPMV